MLGKFTLIILPHKFPSTDQKILTSDGLPSPLLVFMLFQEIELILKGIEVWSCIQSPDTVTPLQVVVFDPV